LNLLQNRVDQVIRDVCRHLSPVVL
jgi:hypothetical protein